MNTCRTRGWKPEGGSRWKCGASPAPRFRVQTELSLPRRDGHRAGPPLCGRGFGASAEMLSRIYTAGRRGAGPAPGVGRMRSGWMEARCLQQMPRQTTAWGHGCRLGRSGRPREAILTEDALRVQEKTDRHGSRRSSRPATGDGRAVCRGLKIFKLLNEMKEPAPRAQARRCEEDEREAEEEARREPVGMAETVVTGRRRSHSLRPVLRRPPCTCELSCFRSLGAGRRAQRRGWATSRRGLHEEFVTC